MNPEVEMKHAAVGAGADAAGAIARSGRRNETANRRPDEAMPGESSMAESADARMDDDLGIDLIRWRKKCRRPKVAMICCRRSLRARWRPISMRTISAMKQGDGGLNGKKLGPRHHDLERRDRDDDRDQYGGPFAVRRRIRIRIRTHPADNAAVEEARRRPRWTRTRRASLGSCKPRS